jgi:hypothetical protein
VLAEVGLLNTTSHCRFFANPRFDIVESRINLKSLEEKWQVNPRTLENLGKP